ncbi:MAG: glycosyltransferase [Halalkalicoccus sp.]|nr:glycosyltransferase [Halalkalicoccus sp.]
MSDRLDVAFVPAECPGSDGTGATHSSTIYIERLSHYHDLTVYVSTQMDAAEATLPAQDRVEYVLHDKLPKLPHPIYTKMDALREERTALEGHDLVHSYSSAFIPVLADLDVPTLLTLNSYLPVCPKADMMYHGERKCSGPGRLKCATCVPATAMKRRQGLEAELRQGYVSMGQIPFVRESMARADEITAYHALSPHLKEDYADLGFPAEATTVVPHFYDEEFHRPRGGPANLTEPITALYVGALQDIKGIDTLVRALALLRKDGREVELQVAGRGPLEGTLRELAADLGVEEAITWLGYVDHGELPDLYRSSDLFVYPGIIDEPFGRVMLEALATHTPIVSADVGSMDYIVGPAGTLFEPGDPESLADAFDALCREYADHREAIPHQLERFAPETVIESLGSLYEDVAATDETPTR